MKTWLLDKKRPDGTYPFQWRGSVDTDVAETFKRVRQEQQTQQPNVRPINQTKRKANV